MPRKKAQKHEEIVLRIPGFTAKASLYAAEERYRWPHSTISSVGAEEFCPNSALLTRAERHVVTATTAGVIAGGCLGLCSSDRGVACYGTCYGIGIEETTHENEERTTYANAGLYGRGRALQEKCLS